MGLPYGEIFAKYWLSLKMGTFSDKFVIKWILNIPPHLNCFAVEENNAIK